MRSKCQPLVTKLQRQRQFGDRRQDGAEVAVQRRLAAGERDLLDPIASLRLARDPREEIDRQVARRLVMQGVVVAQAVAAVQVADVGQLDGQPARTVVRRRPRSGAAVIGPRLAHAAGDDVGRRRRLEQIRPARTRRRRPAAPAATARPGARRGRAVVAGPRAHADQPGHGSRARAGHVLRAPPVNSGKEHSRAAVIAKPAAKTRAAEGPLAPSSPRGLERVRACRKHWRQGLGVMAKGAATARRRRRRLLARSSTSSVRNGHPAEAR